MFDPVVRRKEAPSSDRWYILKYFISRYLAYQKIPAREHHVSPFAGGKPLDSDVFLASRLAFKFG
jgi:hypothetical protein